MTEIELRATNLHWLEESNPYEDCCLHGGVYLRIGETVLSDGNDNDWTVSTAAFNLLKTAHQNHEIDNERPLIPHCGHTMWLVEGESDGLYLGGCDIGIDWAIRHEPPNVVHKLGDERSVKMGSESWRQAVCKFSDEVYEFFLTAWPKSISDKDDRKGFELFMSLWRQYRADADVE